MALAAAAALKGCAENAGAISRNARDGRVPFPLQWQAAAAHEMDRSVNRNDSRG
jgi:hypothetical protein